MVSGLTLPISLFHPLSHDFQLLTCELTDVPSSLPDPTREGWVGCLSTAPRFPLKIYLDGDAVYLNPSSNALRQRGKTRAANRWTDRWMDWKVDRYNTWLNSCKFLWDLNGNTYVVTVETSSVFPTVPVGGLNVANYVRCFPECHYPDECWIKCCLLK